MYQVIRNNGRSQRKQCRGKGRLLIALACLLWLALAAGRVEAVCWNTCWPIGGSGMKTCCDTQQEAAAALPSWACEVVPSSGRVNDYGGAIFFSQCDSSGRPFWNTSIWYIKCSTGDCCLDGQEQVCEDEEGCPGKRTCKNSKWGKCEANKCCPLEGAGI